MVGDNMVGDHRHALFSTHDLVNINALHHLPVVDIIIAFNGLYILHMESEHVVVKDCILYKVGMQALAK